uniref:zinc finger protein JAGGED-like n=1 Tax=Erigeron canadensis TaxID=72917 RepID=UPI001CB9C41C|nr:zinc finger protein JAGGED-like [Erigeron canadensis]
MSSNPLDLNNLPDDFSSRDHGKQQTLDDDSSSSSASAGIFRRKKNGAEDESDKVYECRFCSLKFGKSQALGGHMNRHRQERETETLNKARQLVFSNDSLLPQLPHQIGGQAVVNGGFRHMGSTVYPTCTRLYSAGTTSTTMYPSPSSSRLNNTNPYSSSQYPINDYFVGHVCPNNAPPFTIQSISTSSVPPPDTTNNYTCIGAPVGGPSFTN